MAKGGQKKGKAKGHNKSSSSGSSYSSPSYPPSSISAPRVVRSGVVSKREYNLASPYTKKVALQPSEPFKITSKGRRRLTMTSTNTAYCMKCRKKVEMANPKQVTMKNGRPATQGTCPVCGTKVFRIGK